MVVVMVADRQGQRTVHSLCMGSPATCTFWTTQMSVTHTIVHTEAAAAVAVMAT